VRAFEIKVQGHSSCELCPICISLESTDPEQSFFTVDRVWVRAIDYGSIPSFASSIRNSEFRIKLL